MEGDWDNWGPGWDQQQRQPRASQGDEAREEGEEAGSSGGGAAKRRFSLGLLGKKIASAANNLGEAVARTAAAAGEVITDAELRSRSAQLLSEAARKAGAGVAKGLQQGAGRIAAGPRTVQGILHKLQQRIEEQRLAALLQEQQDAPVDVQVAFQLYEDAPQELRSRLWMALLEHPELCAEYQTLAAALQQQRAAAAAAAGGSDSSDGATPAEQAEAQQAEQDGEAGGSPAGEEAEGGPPAIGEPSALAGADPFSAASSADGEDDTQPADEAGHLYAAAPADAAPDPAHLSTSYSAPWAAQHQQPPSSSTSSGGLGLSPGSLRGSRRHGQAGPEEDSGWQLVAEQGAASRLQGHALLAGAREHPPYCREREGFRNILMTAMMSVHWPLPTSYPPDCRYATLLQISVGQEDTDEVISRDIHRTFPEFSLFSLEQGQQALFNVLKAYALHDMEAGYCQGMAFVAGLLLFYVPEEPAFQLFCRLLSTSGPNLRRLYLPGLEGLKAELRKLDFLLERYLPALTAHLNAAGVVPVLFASQWLLTCFSCPFPVGFACRLVDVMLQENSDAVLLKAAVAVLAECEGDLFIQEDFEEILTYLKVEPVQWPAARLRRVLNAAIASPISAQDLADAEAALQQGFTGSLSRVPTSSSQREVALADEAGSDMQDRPAGGAAGEAGGAEGLATGPLQLGSTDVPAAQQAAAAAAGEDAVAAELAAAAAQQEAELMDMVLALELDLGGTGDAAEEHYSRTLHSATSGDSRAAAQQPR